MTQRGRRASRTDRRTELLARAARTELPESCDVCVVGGGAAGLVAAIAAAEQDARAVVLERDPECGRSILATGNGRCNVANARLDPALYNDPAFVCSVVGDSWLADILAFFGTCGLAWVEEAEGRLYPLSRQAASVRNVLLARAERAGVVLGSAREVVTAHPQRAGFDVRFRECFGGASERRLKAQALILATGGVHATGSADATGSGAASRGGGAKRPPSSQGRPVWNSLGLAARPLVPVLCPLACRALGLAELDGRRAHATLSLVRSGEVLATQRGEVLFRSYGVSGIAVFNLSRVAQPGDVLLLDLLPDLLLEEALPLATTSLDGLLDPVIARVLLGQAGTLARAARTAKEWRLDVMGPAETSRAQVMRGGFLTSQFDPQTLGACGLLGLFACGEALDVDGPCGGFNLAWAWKSGLVAGNAAGLQSAGRIVRRA